MKGAPFIEKQLSGLYIPEGSKAAGEAASRSSKYNRSITDSIPYWQEWREAARQIREYTIHHLDQYLIEFERNITARGAKVFWAETAEEANQTLINIAKSHNVKRVVKGKSMVSEELALNSALASEGIQAIETDLGEFIVQLAGQRPTHIVTPALHFSVEEVGKLFSEKLGEPYTVEHEALTRIARKHLRRAFLEADMGTSGCNFAIADTGTLGIVENEGNIGLSTSAPPIHVAVIGIEKVLPSIQYLPVFLQLLARVGTGQKLTTYTHLINGATPHMKLFVILLDNGRSTILQDPHARRALSCIRCGMCLNVCPVYRRVGGWAYGWICPGPIGSITTPHFVGVGKAGVLAFASTLCGACSDVCPAKVDIPHQLVHLRNRTVQQSKVSRSFLTKVVWKLWSWSMTGRLRYAFGMKLVMIAIRLLPFIPVSLRPAPLSAWIRGRELPRLPAVSFKKMWKARH